jgi:uncharacterized protein (DUF362 family)
MNEVYLYNVPVHKENESLKRFYNNYPNLKEFIFYSLNKSALLSTIKENQRILIKPNWVFHNKGKNDDICLTTHPNVILAVLEYVLTLKPCVIILGDSPLQSCNWLKIFSNDFLTRVKKLQIATDIPIKIVDFRNEIWENKMALQTKCRSESDYILYDLKSSSLLDQLSIQNKELRVCDYDPKVTSANHELGIHKYLIAREVIDSDIIINLPKLKTHQKAGITNGIKNFVGTIGEKAYLAHHSSNLSKNGGDCYPGNNRIRITSEYFSEKAYKYRGSFLYFPMHYLSSIIWRLVPYSDYASLSGSWYGNDTVWRMALDIHKIIKYGTFSGEISNTLQRKIITISDAIVCGQGEGPLKPDPLPLGILAVSNNDEFLDKVMTRLLNFDYSKIPLLKKSSERFTSSNSKVFMNNENIAFDALSMYAVRTIPPKGWKNFIEL